jgi:Kae1-associated kinase Bud32
VLQQMPSKDRELTESEKVSLSKIANEAAEGRKIVGIAVYGSQVAGYATEDSDYDLIVILEDYSPKVKYRYINGEVDASVLVVDRGALLMDADKASLGEFVVGRLLNIYVPLTGGELFHEAEVLFKRRVVLEALEEIEASIGQFAQEILIPAEYFLFDKLKKRAAIYPPALYSYSKTYGVEHGSRNTEVACEGFIEVLKQIEQEGLITLNRGTVQLKDYEPKHWVTRLTEMATYTRRSLAQYAVHGYAGRVGLSIVRREVSSKISRSRKGFEVPDVIKHPRRLWRLQEGLLIIDEDDWFGKLIEHMGIARCKEVVKNGLGEVYSVTKVYCINDGDRVAKITVKNFADLRALKWVVLNMWALLSKRFDMGQTSRLQREYSALRRLRGLGFKTPDILAVVLDQRLLVTEYIEGVDVGQLLPKALSGDDEAMNAVRLYGEALGKVHQEGYTLGDTKPSNTILADGAIYLVDLEQATRNNDRGWDIAEFIYYSSKLTIDEKAVRHLAKEFLNGYLKHGTKESVKESLKFKYLAPFQPILAPNVVRAVRQELRKNSA